MTNPTNHPPVCARDGCNQPRIKAGRTRTGRQVYRRTCGKCVSDGGGANGGRTGGEGMTRARILDILAGLAADTESTPPSVRVQASQVWLNHQPEAEYTEEDAAHSYDDVPPAAHEGDIDD